MLILKANSKRTKIIGDLPRDIVDFIDDASSAYVKNYQFATLFRQRKKDGSRVWDGKVHLFSRATNSFPTGILDIVCDVLTKSHLQFQLEMDDSLLLPPVPSVIPDVFGPYTLYDYQKEAISAFFDNQRLLPGRGIIKIGTGGGKCHRKGTKVILYSGELKAVEDIKQGDLLMGPDSLPRTVINTVSGYDTMYNILPIKGNTWGCTGDHILSLKRTHTTTKGNRKDYKGKEVINISVKEYIKKSKTFKYKYKLFTSDPIVFPSITLPSVDPYFLGLWFGDGTKNLSSVEITSEDPEIVNFLSSFAPLYNLSLIKKTKEGNSASTYALSNKLDNHTLNSNRLLYSLRAIVGETKAVPDSIKYGSVDTRLKFLAGFIDTDGSLHNGSFDIIQKRKDYIEDLAFIARSLGFKSLYKECTKTIKSTGFSGQYWRLSIIGDTESIPVKISRKKALPRKQKKDPRVTGFTILPAGIEEYFGFELSDDRLYLLEDFTVTHNSLIAAAICHIIRVPALVLVHGKKLVRQNYETFKKVFAGEEDLVGLVDSDTWSPSLVTIASTDTIYSRLTEEDTYQVLENIKLVIADECHRATSKSFADIIKATDSSLRLGLSGTPDKKEDDRDLLLHSLTGKIIYTMSIPELKEKNTISRANLICVRLSQPKLDNLDWHEAFETCIVNNVYRHKLIAELARLRFEKDQTMLVLAGNSVALAENLLAYISKVVPRRKIRLVNGKSRPDLVDKAFDGLQSKKLSIVITTTIADEGVDIPSVNGILSAGGGASFTRTVQRVGRALRKKSDGSAAEIIDIMDTTNPYLKKHSLKRLSFYEEEQLFDSVTMLKAYDILPEEKNDKP